MNCHNNVFYDIQIVLKDLFQVAPANMHVQSQTRNLSFSHFYI